MRILHTPRTCVFGCIHLDKSAPYRPRRDANDARSTLIIRELFRVLVIFRRHNSIILFSAILSYNCRLYMTYKDVFDGIMRILCGHCPRLITA